MAVRYEFRCEAHGVFDELRDMGDTSPEPCPRCGGLSRKLISLPYFQEDRSRFWRGANGSRYSSALGCELPDSRSGIEAVCKAKGIEMTTPGELPHVARAIEAGRAIRSGEGLSSKQTFAHIGEPKEAPIPLVETLRKSGRMRDVMERIEVGYENWRDRGESDSVRMAQKGAGVLGEGMAELNKGKPIDLT